MDPKVVTGFDCNDAQAILDELAPEHQLDTDVTVIMAKKSWGISEPQARRRLDKAVEEGSLIKIWGMHRGSQRAGWLYRKPPVK